MTIIALLLFLFGTTFACTELTRVSGVLDREWGTKRHARNLF